MYAGKDSSERYLCINTAKLRSKKSNQLQRNGLKCLDDFCDSIESRRGGGGGEGVTSIHIPGTYLKLRPKSLGTRST